MAVVRDLIATVNRLTQADSPAGAVDPAAAGVAPASDASRYADAGIEPSLEDLLQDPIVQLVMRADRIESADVRRALHAARQGAAAAARTAQATATREP